MPDGTNPNGNARGQYAVDLQLSSFANTAVASGNYSFCAGQDNTASGANSVALGKSATASASGSIAISGIASANGAVAIGSTTASGSGSVAIGQFGGTASGANSTCVGGYLNVASAESAGTFAGFQAVANKVCQIATGAERFSVDGDAQHSTITLAGATTDATVTEIFCGRKSNQRMTVPASRTWMADVDVVARSSGGTDNACFKRRLIIKRDASNNTALVGSVLTVDTDIGSNAGAPPAGWAVTLTADDTNESLKLEVTGAAATNIRWVSKVSLVEVGYA